MEYSEKKHDGSSSSIEKAHMEFYDPSKESIWTRLGVNFESFKRAPGTTG
jgi:amino acid transporter